MSIEKQENSQSKEELFKNWLSEFQGRFWLNPDAMPKGVYEELQTYKHWEVNGESRSRTKNERSC